MSKPHQHFIPRTYLEKFAIERSKDEKYFLTALNKQSGKLINDISVRDVCVETDLYTLKHQPETEKYKIEDFFSQHIESKYPAIYTILVKEKKEFISGEERALILYTTLSMYFRTPKGLNNFAKFAAETATKLKADYEADSINFLGYAMSIKDKSFDEIRKEIRENRRIDHIQLQMAVLHQFVKFKALDGFMVIELAGNKEFVTGDNPVIMTNAPNTVNGMFNGDNAIYIPLDLKHALFIAPGNEGGIVNKVFYVKDSFFQHITLNHRVYESAERWILGTPAGINGFLKDKQEYAKPANDDHPIIKTFEKKLQLMSKMVQLMERGISNDNKELIEFMKELQKNELYRDHAEFQDTMEKLRAQGLDI
jgi:hypothetical protein